MAEAKRAVSLMIAPNDAYWQGALVMLCEDGSVYVRPVSAGLDESWEQVAPPLVSATAEVSS